MVYFAAFSHDAYDAAALSRLTRRVLEVAPHLTGLPPDKPVDDAMIEDIVEVRPVADFVGMPDGPVKIITMPKFQQGFSVAYDDAPGALERHLDNFYAVSPIPADWSDEQAASFLSEYNDYMIHDLSVHEGVPGHYLQLDHASRDPSVLRAVLGSGPFIEGWAV